MLVQRLDRYRLRSRWCCTIFPPSSPSMPPGAAQRTCRPAPSPPPTRGCRMPAGGYSPTRGWPQTPDAAAWDAHRLSLGLPDGSRDMEPDKTVLLEAGFDELHGVSWSKGCYMGQELTARTKYRGLVKRRLVPVAIAGPTPGARNAGGLAAARRSARCAPAATIWGWRSCESTRWRNRWNAGWPG